MAGLPQVRRDPLLSLTPSRLNLDLGQDTERVFALEYIRGLLGYVLLSGVQTFIGGAI